MIRQVTEFPDVIQNAAKEYVCGYLRDTEVRGNHLTFMRTCDQCKNPYIRQMAECIDVLLFERMLIESAEIQQENDNWHDDAKYW